MKALFLIALVFAAAPALAQDVTAMPPAAAPATTAPHAPSANGFAAHKARLVATLEAHLACVQAAASEQDIMACGHARRTNAQPPAR